MLGVGMYWGEGSKRIRKFDITNADPAFITAWIKWCNTYIPGERIRVEVAIHPDVPEESARQYWAGIVGPGCGLRINRVKLWKHTEGEAVRLPHGVAKVYSSHGVEWHTKMLEWIRLAAVM